MATIKIYDVETGSTIEFLPLGDAVSINFEPDDRPGAVIKVSFTELKKALEWVERELNEE